MICSSLSALLSVLVQTFSRPKNQTEAVDDSAQPHVVSAPWSFTSMPLCTFVLYVYFFLVEGISYSVSACINRRWDHIHLGECSGIVVLFYVLFVLYCSMYCLCVNVYCQRVTTQLQLSNISYLIKR